MGNSTKSSVPWMGLCIDWETSGSTWGGKSTDDYQGVSFGAVIFKFADFEPVEALYKEIIFDANRYKWSDEAEEVHGLSRDHLAKNGVSPEDAAIDFASMLVEYFDPQKKIMLLGHNREFDIDFTKQLLEPFGLMFKIHHVCLDTSGIGLVAMGQYKSNLLFESLGFEKRGKHSALEDALMTVETCQRIRMLVNAGLGQ